MKTKLLSILLICSFIIPSCTTPSGVPGAINIDLTTLIRPSAAFAANELLNRAVSQSDKEYKAKILFVTSNIILSFTDETMDVNEIAAAIREATGNKPAWDMYAMSIANVIYNAQRNRIPYAKIITEVANGIKDVSQSYVP